MRGRVVFDSLTYVDFCLSCLGDFLFSSSLTFGALFSSVALVPVMSRSGVTGISQRKRCEPPRKSEVRVQ